jgi:glycosyltransferase involved in cell wall biosynthesis
MWIVVDDGSTDETPVLLARLSEELGFMRVLSVDEHAKATPDRLAVAAEARAFNIGLNSVDWHQFTHIAKLDGDIELPPRYFELLLGEFAEDEALGLAGGVLNERTRDGWKPETGSSDYHVRGALKCYSESCLRAIDQIEERLGWDTTDEVYARMRGFSTRSLYELVALHHRPLASADGLLRGWARHGRCAYIAHYPLAWVLPRAVKMGFRRPRIASGFAFIGGYLWAALTRVPQIEDPAFRSFMRGELGRRARGLVARARPAAAP